MTSAPVLWIQALILFNTCCVRENAENKVFGNLGQLKKLKEKNRNKLR